MFNIRAFFMGALLTQLCEGVGVLLLTQLCEGVGVLLLTQLCEGWRFAAHPVVL